MNCAVCKRDTSPIKIGGLDYCQACGTPYAGRVQAASAASAAAKPRVMDMGPRRAPASAGAPVPKPAGALHERVKSHHVVDLRDKEPIPIPEKLTSEAAIHGHANHTPAAAPKTTAQERHVAQFTDRFDLAKKYGRSEYVSRFGPEVDKMRDKFGNLTLAGIQETATSGTTHKPTSTSPMHRSIIVPGAGHLAEMPHLAAAQHSAMTQLSRPTPPATPMAQLNARPSWRPNLTLSPRSGRTLATAAVVVIMAGYVWVQNYPKMALQAADGRAGLSASLPGYMPSSYTLARTDTGPGQITLNYGSPSATETLKIAQTRTTWDSNSLLDNFVAANTDDYASVQGEGLTIYIFNNNQAAWVNHGIRYSIEGAGLLSRDEILKIAYSL